MVGKCREWLRVSLTNLIIQIDLHVSLSLVWREVLLLNLKKEIGYLRLYLLSRQYVYQCLSLTLVSFFVTFILVIAHV